MIGVVVPVHNEEALLRCCLRALVAAARRPGLCGEAVLVVLVLDDCDDASIDIAAQFDVLKLEIRARSVGVARATGAEAALRLGARWLAFTDADTRVSPDWLVEQLKLGAELVCGTVAVDDWSAHAPELRHRYEALYVDADDHRHIHGANFGISAAAYRLAGGFTALAVSEDVALVRAAAAAGVEIAWSAAPRVITSARREVRICGGFADYLLALA